MGLSLHACIARFQQRERRVVSRQGRRDAGMEPMAAGLDQVKLR